MKNPYLELISSVWRNGKPWRKTIVGYYFAYIIAQVFLSLNPYAFGRTIDILQHFEPERLSEVIFWLSTGIIVLLLFWIFHGPARIVERQVAMKIQQAFRVKLYQQLTQLPLKWHQEHHSGNIISRINRAATALFRFASDQFIYIETIIKFIISISFLLWISLPVGLLSLLSCALSIATVLYFDRKLIPLYNAQNEVDNQVGAISFDYLSNMTTILTLRLGDLTRSHLWLRMLSIWPFFRKDTILNEVKWFSVGMLLTSLQSIILIGYVIYALKSSDTIMIGTVVMIFRYQSDLSEVFYTFSSFYSELVRMNTDVKGLQPILDDINRLTHAPNGSSLARQWHTIDISNLNFYHTNGITTKKVFDNLNLKLARGEKIALIGGSGGGKSTLLNILRGLYIPDAVKLEIDNVPFDTLEPLQVITTLIPQDPEIFENTILYNITLDVETTPEEVERAIHLANFTNVVADLPEGLNTPIKEKGLNLSVGQKQRLALARGLFAARYSSIILMDEPTSSVDLPTEAKIISNIIKTFPDSTVLISLHRLHLLPKFDRIILLGNGQILTDGPAELLLQQEGPVRKLWRAGRSKQLTKKENNKD